MSDLPERPASLRRAPRPAADEGTDPIDFIPPSITAARDRVERSDGVDLDAKEPTTIAAERAAPGVETPLAPTAEVARPETIRTGRVGRPRQRDVAVAFSTRVSIDVLDLIEDTVVRTGLTQRAIVEEAIRSKWGAHQA